jgi:hypothetical protein
MKKHIPEAAERRMDAEPRAALDRWPETEQDAGFHGTRTDDIGASSGKPLPPVFKPRKSVA